MPNYKKMYFELFNAVSDTILNLQKAQQQGEKSYMETETQILPVLPVRPRKKKRSPKS